MTSPMPRRQSIMRSLGQFVGQIAKGVKADVRAGEPGKRFEVRRETHEETREAPAELGGGMMKVRRTTIEEIEIEPPSLEKGS